MGMLLNNNKIHWQTFTNCLNIRHQITKGVSIYNSVSHNVMFQVFGVQNWWFFWLKNTIYIESFSFPIFLKMEFAKLEIFSTKKEWFHIDLKFNAIAMNLTTNSK